MQFAVGIVSCKLAGKGVGTCKVTRIVWGTLTIEEPGSSVNIVYDYGLDDRAIEVRYPAEARGFFL
jgi:hypothetical protein